MAVNTVEKVVDARGTYCPGPLMELIRAVREAEVGQVIALLSSDPGSKSDIPVWAKKAGQEFLGTTSHEGYDEIRVRRTH